MFNLKNGQLIRLNGDGTDGQIYRTPDTSLKVGKLLHFDCVIDLKSEGNIYFEITSDEFGRITLSNGSNQKLWLNDELVTKQRPLLSDSIIAINDEVKFRWIFTKTADDDKQIDKAKKEAEYASWSAPGKQSRDDASNKKPLSKRLTVHPIFLISSMEEDSSLSSLTKNNTLPSFVDENVENINASNCSIQIIQNTSNIFKNTSMSDAPKINNHTVDGDKSTIELTATPLRPLDLSGTLMTSFGGVPVKTPVSAYKRPGTTPKTTPSNLAFQTIEQNEGNNQKSHSFCMTKTPVTKSSRHRNSMHLIDFTTPEIFHTPSTSMNRQRTLLQSALNNTTRKMVTTAAQDDSIQQSFVSSKQSPSAVTPNRRCTPKKTPKISPPPSTVLASLEKKQQQQMAKDSPNSTDLSRTQSPSSVLKSKRLSTTPNIKKLSQLFTSTPFIRSERDKGRMIENQNILDTPGIQEKPVDIVIADKNVSLKLISSTVTKSTSIDEINVSERINSPTQSELIKNSEIMSESVLNKTFDILSETSENITVKENEHITSVNTVIDEKLASSSQLASVFIADERKSINVTRFTESIRELSTEELEDILLEKNDMDVEAVYEELSEDILLAGSTDDEVDNAVFGHRSINADEQMEQLSVKDIVLPEEDSSNDQTEVINGHAEVVSEIRNNNHDMTEAKVLYSDITNETTPVSVVTDLPNEIILNNAADVTKENLMQEIDEQDNQQPEINPFEMITNIDEIYLTDLANVTADFEKISNDASGIPTSQHTKSPNVASDSFSSNLVSDLSEPSQTESENQQQNENDSGLMTTESTNLISSDNQSDQIDKTTTEAVESEIESVTKQSEIVDNVLVKNDELMNNLEMLDDGNRIIEEQNSSTIVNADPIPDEYNQLEVFESIGIPNEHKDNGLSEPIPLEQLVDDEKIFSDDLSTVNELNFGQDDDLEDVVIPETQPVNDTEDQNPLEMSRPISPVSDNKSISMLDNVPNSTEKPSDEDETVCSGLDATASNEVETDELKNNEIPETQPVLELNKQDAIEVSRSEQTVEDSVVIVSDSLSIINEQKTQTENIDPITKLSDSIVNEIPAKIESTTTVTNSVQPGPSEEASLQNQETDSEGDDVIPATQAEKSVVYGFIEQSQIICIDETLINDKSTSFANAEAPAQAIVDSIISIDSEMESIIYEAESSAESENLAELNESTDSQVNVQPDDKKIVVPETQDIEQSITKESTEEIVLGKNESIVNNEVNLEQSITEHSLDESLVKDAEKGKLIEIKSVNNLETIESMEPVQDLVSEPLVVDVKEPETDGDQVPVEGIESVSIDVKDQSAKEAVPLDHIANVEHLDQTEVKAEKSASLEENNVENGTYAGIDVRNSEEDLGSETAKSIASAEISATEMQESVEEIIISKNTAHSPEEDEKILQNELVEEKQIQEEEIEFEPEEIAEKSASEAQNDEVLVEQVHNSIVAMEVPDSVQEIEETKGAGNSETAKDESAVLLSLQSANTDSGLDSTLDTESIETALTTDKPTVDSVPDIEEQLENKATDTTAIVSAVEKTINDSIALEQAPETDIDNDLLKSINSDKLPETSVKIKNTPSKEATPFKKLLEIQTRTEENTPVAKTPKQYPPSRKLSKVSPKNFLPTQEVTTTETTSEIVSDKLTKTPVKSPSTSKLNEQFQTPAKLSKKTTKSPEKVPLTKEVTETVKSPEIAEEVTARGKTPKRALTVPKTPASKRRVNATQQETLAQVTPRTPRQRKAPSRFSEDTYVTPVKRTPKVTRSFLETGKAIKEVSEIVTVHDEADKASATEKQIAEDVSGRRSCGVVVATVVTGDNLKDTSSAPFEPDLKLCGTETIQEMGQQNVTKSSQIEQLEKQTDSANSMENGSSNKNSVPEKSDEVTAQNKSTRATGRTRKMDVANKETDQQSELNTSTINAKDVQETRRGGRREKAVKEPSVEPEPKKARAKANAQIEGRDNNETETEIMAIETKPVKAVSKRGKKIAEFAEKVEQHSEDKMETANEEHTRKRTTGARSKKTQPKTVELVPLEIVADENGQEEKSQSAPLKRKRAAATRSKNVTVETQEIEAAPKPIDEENKEEQKGDANGKAETISKGTKAQTTRQKRGAVAEDPSEEHTEEAKPKATKRRGRQKAEESVVEEESKEIPKTKTTGRRKQELKVDEPTTSNHLTHPKVANEEMIILSSPSPVKKTPASRRRKPVTGESETDSVASEKEPKHGRAKAVADTPDVIPNTSNHLSQTKVVDEEVIILSSPSPVKQTPISRRRKPVTGESETKSVASEREPRRVRGKAVADTPDVVPKKRNRNVMKMEEDEVAVDIKSIKETDNTENDQKNERARVVKEKSVEPEASAATAKRGAKKETKSKKQTTKANAEPVPEPEVVPVEIQTTSSSTETKNEETNTTKKAKRGRPKAVVNEKEEQPNVETLEEEKISKKPRRGRKANDTETVTQDEKIEQEAAMKHEAPTIEEEQAPKKAKRGRKPNVENTAPSQNQTDQEIAATLSVQQPDNEKNTNKKPKRGRKANETNVSTDEDQAKPEKEPTVTKRGRPKAIPAVETVEEEVEPKPKRGRNKATKDAATENAKKASDESSPVAIKTRAGRTQKKKAL